MCLRSAFGKLPLILVGCIFPTQSIAQENYIRESDKKPELMCRTPILRTFEIANEYADIIISLIEEIYTSDLVARVRKLGDRQIIVWASPAHQQNIAKQITIFNEALTELERNKPKKQDRDGQELFLYTRDRVLARLKTIASIEVKLMTLEALSSDSFEQKLLLELSTKIGKLREANSTAPEKKKEK